jgi:hypothetical protein
MAHAIATAWSTADIRIPRLAMPKLRWPRPSQRTRALLMMGLMISPAFLADSIGYCVERLFLTADQIAAKQVPDATILGRAQIFRVACADTDISAMDRARWASFATQHGWPRYPEAGPSCFKPDQALYGIVGLKMFSVACPQAILSVADQRQWAAFAANHGWTEYPQAGAGCVDP